MRLLLIALAAASLYGDVADSSPAGFTIQSTFAIQAPPDAVYQSFMTHVGEWWNPAHTFSRNAGNLSIEPKVLGCFCEKLPAGGGGVRHLQIVYLDPGKVVRFTGGLGPFQAMPVNGTLTIQFAPAESGTKLSLTYAVGGYHDKGLNTVAPMADAMLTEQFTRLKTYIETGSPTAAKK